MPGADQYLGNYPVVEQTGLKGEWDFGFRYTKKGGPALPDRITLFDAIDKQLGLKLELTKVPLPVIVVDRVNRNPTDNSPEVAKALPPLRSEFEVADVKPSSPDCRQMRLQFQPGGRVVIQGMTLKAVIQRAWDISDEMIARGPSWRITTASMSLRRHQPGWPQVPTRVSQSMRKLSGKWSVLFLRIALNWRPTSRSAPCRL
jgi:hypothetical protein